MIKKITFGNPFNTESVIKNIPTEKDISFVKGKSYPTTKFSISLSFNPAKVFIIIHLVFVYVIFYNNQKYLCNQLFLKLNVAKKCTSLKPK